jgi:hypothetical protein
VRVWSGDRFLQPSFHRNGIIWQPLQKYISSNIVPTGYFCENLTSTGRGILKAGNFRENMCNLNLTNSNFKITLRHNFWPSQS